MRRKNGMAKHVVPNVHAFLVILKRELIAIIKERTILIAFLIQLFIASFSSALFVGLMSIYNPSAASVGMQIDLDVGLINDSSETEIEILSESLSEALQQHNATVIPFTTTEEAERAFNAGKIDAAILAPSVAENESAIEIKLFLPQSETLSTLILLGLQDGLKAYENDLRQRNGITLRYSDLGGELPTGYEFRYAVILPLLMFFPAFVTGGMVIDAISEELVNRTLDTLWSAPLSLNVIFGAKIATALILSGIQCGLWLILLRLNGVVIQNMLWVLLVGVISAAIVALVAALITLIFKDREQSQFIYAIFVLFATGLSYLTDLSPIAMVTRLASGDYYAGPEDVAMYATLLLVLLAGFFSITKKLLAMPSM